MQIMPYNNRFKLRTVSPMQSMAEKMLLLHEQYYLTDPPINEIEGTSRHLYDIVQLYEQFQRMGMEFDRTLLNKLRHHRKCWFGRNSMVFRNSNFKKLCFIPPESYREILTKDFNKLRKSTIFDPTWDYDSLRLKIMEINAKINGNQFPGLDNEEGDNRL